MIISEIFYGLKCDRCGDVFDDSEHSFWTDQGAAMEYAEESDWKELNGRHYCQSCHEVDEETEEVRPLAAYPKHLKTFNGFIDRIVGGRRQLIEYNDHFLAKCNFYHRPKLEAYEVEYIKSLLGENFVSLEYEQGKYNSFTCFIKIKKQEAITPTPPAI